MTGLASQVGSPARAVRKCEAFPDRIRRELELSYHRIRKQCVPIRKDSQRSGPLMHFRPGRSLPTPSLPIPPFLLLILRSQDVVVLQSYDANARRKQRKPWMERAIFRVKHLLVEARFYETIKCIGKELWALYEASSNSYSAFSPTISSTACSWRVLKLPAAWKDALKSLGRSGCFWCADKGDPRIDLARAATAASLGRRQT